LTELNTRRKIINIVLALTRASDTLKAERKMKMKLEKKLLDHNLVDCVYFFTSYDCRNNMKNRSWFHLNDNLNQDDQKKFFEFIKNHKSEIREIIKKNGFKFYTTDADDESKCHGYYLKNWHDGTKTIDFDPIDDFTEADLGHVKLYYREGGKFKQL
jgi:hypothetical protein